MWGGYQMSTMSTMSTLSSRQRARRNLHESSSSSGLLLKKKTAELDRFHGDLIWFNRNMYSFMGFHIRIVMMIFHGDFMGVSHGISFGNLKTWLVEKIPEPTVWKSKRGKVVKRFSNLGALGITLISVGLAFFIALTSSGRCSRMPCLITKHL